MKLSKVKGKEVVVKFEGGTIVSDAGMLLLREVEEQSRIIARISKCIYDKRHASYVRHEVKTLLSQRIYGIACGYEDVNDQDKLRDDLCFQTCVGKEEQMGCSSTISRFENSITRETIVKISKEMVELFIESQKETPEEIVLDFDPTDNKLHGNQEKRHYHGYYKEDCYFPLHVFCKDQLVVSMLRPSDIDGAKYAGAILQLLAKRFREVWSDVKIIFRADSGFARKHILHWCENNNVKYIVGMPGNSRLQTKARVLVDLAKKDFETTEEKQKIFDDFFYAAESWNNKRRIIVKAQHNKNGSNTRFLVTNKTESSEILYSEQYCPRGDMENHIKQLKLDLYSNRNSCSKFFANYFRVLLSSIAYILITEFKNKHLRSTTFFKAYCNTIRLKLFKIGAIVLKNTRRIIFSLSSTHPHQDDFLLAVQSLVPS